MSTSVRPPSFSLSLHALLALPGRVCNPPPAASSVRSCKVTPLLKITLDDILNKRHLPPLTLKDFEEWLVFVEGNPQYLYFILWLKEYESRYAAWVAESGCTLPMGSHATFASTSSLIADFVPGSPSSPHGRGISFVNFIPPSPTLALFFTRAKQTFLDPACNSPYALGRAALLALASASNASSPQSAWLNDCNSLRDKVDLPPSLATQPHPHPRELAPLAIYARNILKESVERFAETACHNVGTRRAWCGVAAGTIMTLVLGILPALAAYFFAPSRWWRVVGWFGCWFGGTIVVSSLHGICMVIYIFGDLRQLRSFELARPSISEPRAIARARPRHKSIFSHDFEEDDMLGGTGIGVKVKSEIPSTSPIPNVAQTSASMSAGNGFKFSRKPAIPKNAKMPKMLERKRPSSTKSISVTSTGTPAIRLGSETLRVDLGTITTESDLSITTSTSTADGATREGGEIDDEDDFGIEISPAYYYSSECGPPAAGTDRGEYREGLRSASNESMIGLAMRWVLGRRRSVGVATGTNERIAEIIEKTTQGTVQVRSHAGTFGIRSWPGGLGSMPDQGACQTRGDLEKDIDISQTERSAKDSQHSNTDAEPPFEHMLTASFIAYGYPEPEPQTAGTISLAALDPDLKEISTVGIAEKKTPIEKKRVSSPALPALTVDFDKILATVPSPRMSSPSTQTSSSSFTYPASNRALSPTQHLLPSPPPPALYAHPGARLLSPSPAFTPAKQGVGPPPSIGKRQWWDRCPRHPAVEATLAVQMQDLPPSLSPDAPISPASSASRDVHSRAHADMRNGIDIEVSMASSADSMREAMRYSNMLSKPTTWRARLRRVMAVPAFGPVTRVLEPVVSRGQWEIVMRSTYVAALCAWFFIGCLVAFPERV